MIYDQQRRWRWWAYFILHSTLFLPGFILAILIYPFASRKYLLRRFTSLPSLFPLRTIRLARARDIRMERFYSYP